MTGKPPQLHVRRTPVPDGTEWRLDGRLQTALRELFNTCVLVPSDTITVGPERLEWLEGLRAGLYSSLDERERMHLVAILDIVREGGSVDLWYVVP